MVHEENNVTENSGFKMSLPLLPGSASFEPSYTACAVSGHQTQ